MSSKPAPRIGVIGNAGIDASGGLLGAAKLALAIQSLGARAALAALVPSDRRGDAITRRLERSGVDASRVERSREPCLRMGDLIDVAGLFDMDAVLITVSDPRLHRFLADLPVHTAPNARLIGLLDHLGEASDADEWETVLRHDAFIATTVQLCRLSGAAQTSSALDVVQDTMIGHNLRVAAVWDEDGAAWIVEKTERTPGKSADFDRFAAAATVVFAARRPWSDVFELTESS